MLETTKAFKMKYVVQLKRHVAPRASNDFFLHVT